MTAKDLLRYCVNCGLVSARNQGIEEAAMLIEAAYGFKSADYVRTLKAEMPASPDWGEDVVLKPDSRDTMKIIDETPAAA